MLSILLQWSLLKKHPPLYSTSTLTVHGTTDNPCFQWMHQFTFQLLLVDTHYLTFYMCV